MKKLLHSLLAVLLSSNALAYDAEIDGIYYNLNSETQKATVTSKDNDFNSYSGDVIIPSSVTYSDVNYSVTSIGSRAFADCTGLTSITFPNSVTNIGMNAFSGCTAMTSIMIPNSVTSIGAWAFRGCAGLTSIEIPNSVMSIGVSAFSGCTGLTSIEIPNSVTSMAANAFIGCTDLSSVTVNSNTVVSPKYKSSSNLGNIFGSQVKKYILGEDVTSIGDYAFYGCTGMISIEIPNSVTSIGSNVFSGCTGLTSINIPNSIINIGDNAFSGCTGLTSIEIPNSVINIGDNAFSGCTGLTSVKINSGAIVSKNYGYDKSSKSYISLRNIFGEQVTEYVIGNEVASIGDYAFYKCTNLTSITIPNSVTSIGNNAFYGCDALISVAIPNSVTSIGEGAFVLCTALTSVVIPNGVKEIGYYAFSGCTGLTYIKVSDENPLYDSRNNCNAIIETESNTLISGCKNTIIPNSVTNIGDGVFSYCTGLTSVKIPNSVTSIGVYAFAGCSGLTSIEIPNSVISIGNYAFSSCTGLPSITIPNSVTNIGDGVFSYCSGLISVVIPNSVTCIGYSTFYDCSDLTSIVIPNSVTSIGNNAFTSCTSLTSIVIPNSVTSIGNVAFDCCTGLTSVEIPNSVTSIGWNAFSRCTNLAYVTIGNKVTSIGNEAFSGCTGLTSVACEASTPPTMGSNVFSKVDKSACTLYVPEESMWSYARTDQWKDFSAIKINPISVDGIYYYLNSNAKVARVTAGARKYSGSVTIPSSITYSSVTYNVTGINDGTFSGCEDLTSVTINNNSIVSATYSFSSNLGNIFGKQVEQYILGDEVTTIGANAFNGCTALKNISIGSGIENVGSKAFANCRKLEDVYCYVVRYPMTDDDIFENSYIEFATLHVPNKSINQYKNKVPWSGFMEVVGIDDMTGINNIEDSKENNIRTYYDTNGRILSAPQKGMNIVKKANGQTIKIFVK